MEEEESDSEENKANVSEKILSGDYEVCITVINQFITVICIYKYL